MARRRTASIQARHRPECPITATRFDFDKTRCRCGKPGPMYYIVSRSPILKTKTGEPKQIREAVGHNRTYAERAVAKVRDRIDQGDYAPPANLRFEQWADDWLGALRRPGESTMKQYETTMRYARATFGNVNVRQLTTADVAAFLQRIADEGAGATTQRNHLRILGQCLEAAIRRTPPLATVNAARKLDESQRPQGDDRQASPFEPAELAKLWQHLPEPFLTMAQLSAWTGMRQGELVALRWGDVDLTGRVIHVRQSYSHKRQAGFGKPKSPTSSRDVILSEKAIALLGAMPTVADDKALVFPGQGRHGQLVSSTIRRALYVAMEAADVPRKWKPDHKPRDFHSFRHSFASAALGSGIGLEWIKEQLGHSSVQTTERAYGHFLTGARQRLAAQLDAALV